MGILIPETEEKNSVWDRFVPIVQTENKKKKTYHVYLMDSIESPGNYSELIHLLNNATKDDTVVIYVNNYGGILDSAFMIRNSMAKSKAKIKGVLDGSVASAATVIALACEELEINDNVAWLSHNYSVGIQGKGGELKSQMEFNNTALAESFREMHRNFLTDKEIENVLEDKDIWLDSKEVRKRWKRYAKSRKKV